MRRFLITTLALATLFLGTAGPALACGGIFSRNGEVNLTRTTTLAAWHDGVEHYVTAFEFAGGGGEFGSIIPLPGVPTAVEKGGEWTLQRLVREVAPQPAFAEDSAGGRALAASSSAQVLLEVKIDALDLTVLEGGGAAVGEWAAQNGFLLTPDAPEILDFYAKRSPIFLAARFDAEAARERGVSLGDGTPVHLTIPTENPWVPLRILGLGRQESEQVEADVFLLTDDKPALLPIEENSGLVLSRSEAASENLLADLRTDRGMEWMPEAMWLSYLRIDASPAQLDFDLAVDVTGAGKPSALAAGLLDGERDLKLGGGDAEDGGNSAAMVVTLVGLGLAAVTVVGVGGVAAGRRGQ